MRAIERVSAIIIDTERRQAHNEQLNSIAAINRSRPSGPGLIVCFGISRNKLSFIAIIVTVLKSGQPLYKLYSHTSCSWCVLGGLG